MLSEETVDVFQKCTYTKSVSKKGNHLHHNQAQCLISVLIMWPSPDTHRCSWTLRPPSVWSSTGLSSGRIAAVSSRSSRQWCESEPLSDSEQLRCCGSRPGSEPSVSAAELLILRDKTIRNSESDSHRQLMTAVAEAVIMKSHTHTWSADLIGSRGVVVKQRHMKNRLEVSVMDQQQQFFPEWLISRINHNNC